MNKKNKVYLASPWFNVEQSERELRIKNELRRLGYDVFSPRECNSLSPITAKSVREKVFSNNIQLIMNSNIVFAITDGKDMGTIWEAGFAYGMKKEAQIITGNKEINNIGPAIVYYCETLGDGKFNLMLAESANAIITEFDKIKNLDLYLKDGSALHVESVE